MALLCWLVIAAPQPPAIDTVACAAPRRLEVNGQPFLPIMIWLQDPERFPQAHAAGINTICGYWPGSGGTADVVEYYQRVAEAGFYAVLPYHAGLRGQDKLLGYIHDDEPDLTNQVSEARITPSAGLRINNGTPLWRILDGVTSSWSVLDPLDGAALTITPKEPVTLSRVGLWLTISPGLAVAKEVELRSGDRLLAQVSLENRRGQQLIAWAAPVTVESLTLRVLSSYPGEQVWGSLSELEGFDAEGRNVLQSVPREVPRQTPAETMAAYQAMRAGDPTRPVFLTLTGRFLDPFAKWSPEERAEYYPAYCRAADVVGFDIYPIYGYGRPDLIATVADGTAALAAMAGERPLYSWIETSAGGQWVTEANQKPVEPRHIRVEVWMSIVHGATAIGYFTHIWKPAYSQFGVPDENVAAMRAINEQLTRLAPAILAPAPAQAPAIRLSGDLRASIIAREHDGWLYLFAVNCDPRDQPGEATITVPGLRAGATVEVIDEGRAITAGEGTFADTFEALGVRLYRVRAGG